MRYAMNKRQNDEQLLESLYIAHYRTVYRLIANRLYQRAGTYADADDLTQEVFIFAAKRIDTLRAHPNPAGWLLKTAHFMAMNHIHSKAQHKEQLFHSLDLHGVCGDLLAAETDASLQSMLSPEDYALLHAYCVEERPHEEICRQFGLSQPALRMRISRLRKFLMQNFTFLVTFLLRQYI